MSGPRETEDPAWAEEAFALLGRFIVTLKPSPACANERECSICWESLQGSGSSHDSPPVVRLPCTHAFHLLCIGRWFVDCERSSCPTCRSELGAASTASRVEHHETTRAPPPGPRPPVRLAERAMREGPAADRVTFVRPSLRRAVAASAATAAAAAAPPPPPPAGPPLPDERRRPPPPRSVAPAAVAAPRPVAGDASGRPSRSSAAGTAASRHVALQAAAAASRQAALQAVARQAAAALAAAVRPRMGEAGRGAGSPSYSGRPVAGRPPPPPLARPYSRGAAAAAAAAPPLSPRQPPAPVSAQHEGRRGTAACPPPSAPGDPRSAAQATASTAAPAEGGWAELWQQ